MDRNDPYAVPGETRLTAAPRRLTPTVIVGRRRSMPVSVESTISLWNAHGTHHGGCHGYGLMHLPEPATALREILRVLRPGGRAALSVWDAAGVGFALVYEAVRARGSMDVALPHGPDFFQFGSTERMRAALQEAGFADAAAYSFPQNWHVANTDRYIEAILTGTVRARAVLAAQSANAAAGVRSLRRDNQGETQRQSG